MYIIVDSFPLFLHTIQGVQMYTIYSWGTVPCNLMPRSEVVYTEACCEGLSCVLFVLLDCILGSEKDAGIRASILTGDLYQHLWPGHVLLLVVPFYSSRL